MMLVRIIAIVLLVFILLWGFLEWTKYMSLRESFEGENIPPPPPNYQEPSAGAILMSAFGDLPAQEQVMATESHKESTVDLNQRVSEYAQGTNPDTAVPVVATVQTNQFQQQVQPQTQLQPTRPLWQQLREQRQSGASPYVARMPTNRIISTRPTPPPAPSQRTVQYALMLSELENNAYESCYIDNCEPVQDYITESCKGFIPECTIQELQNIENCMYSYKDRCDQTPLEECRNHCRNQWGLRSSRSEIKQDEFMKSNERLTSENGQTVLVLRDNGEIELYYNQELTWKSNTNRSEIGGGSDKGPFTLKMHGNGDLVLSNGLGLEVWHTNTWLETLGAGFINAPYVLKLGQGYFYIENKSRQILWRNNTSTL
jgi:hypothetical protein